MSHTTHEQFTKSAFTSICDNALSTLPDIDAGEPYEDKATLALEHLKTQVSNYCGVSDGFAHENVEGFPKWIQLASEIAGIIEFDSVHYHETSQFFYKAPLILNYLKKAIGTKD